MTSENSKANDEARIRELIDNWVKALRAKDINRIVSNYAPDILLFDVPPPLQYKGVNAYRKNWEERFPAFQGPVGCEIRDLSITAGNNAAFCHCLNRISGALEGERKWICGCA